MPVMKSASRQFVDGWITSIREASGNWHRFWFDPADPYTLGIMRLLTGWMLVYNLLVWGLDLQAFFGFDGLLPLQSILDFHGRDPIFSFWFYVPEQWITTAHWSCVGIAVLFFLGVGTRVTSVLAFLITISYSQRVPIANFGLDQILGMLCLYLAIGPSGACLSVDNWWRRRRAQKQGIVPTESRHASARVALRLIQLHMCVIYFWAGIAKLKGDSWFTGEAMWQVLANQEYQTMDLTWMAWIPWLPFLVAHVTVLWEMSFCVLIWNQKLRPLMLLIGTGMHFGIGAFLGMWTFGLVMTFAYFSYGDPAAWRRRFGWVARFGRSGAVPDRQSTTVVQSTLAAIQESPSVAVAVEPVEQHHSPEKPIAPEEPPVVPQAVPAAVPAVVPAAVPVTVPAPAASGTPSRESRPPKINTPLIPRPKSPAAEDPADESPEHVTLNSESALLLISLSIPERNVLRRYFRQHDIVCRAATTAENGLTLATSLNPVAVLVAGTRMKSEELATLLEDLEDVCSVPTLALTSNTQARQLSGLGLSARFLLYPVSPKQVRAELADMLFGCGADRHEQHEPVDQTGRLEP